MRRRISKKGGLLPPSFLPMGWKTGVFRATARDGGCTALRCGNEPPFSFRLRRKDCARRRVSEPTAAKRRLLGEDKRPFTVKKRRFRVQNLPVRAGLDRCGGRARPRGGDLGACAGCAILWGNREGASPHLMVRRGFRGGRRMTLLLFPHSSLHLALPGRS